MKSGILSRPITWIILFLFAGAGMIFLAGALTQAPGYMDADYYYANAIQLAEGRGFVQPFLWNYMDDPHGLPHPAFTFWMPLVSLIGAAGYALWPSFTGARLFLCLIAAAIPALTVWMGLCLHGKLKLAVLGGLFALFPVYYWMSLSTTDGFALYMLLGSVFLVLATGKPGRRPWLLVILGAIAGLMHMTRADGALWLAGAGAWLLWSDRCERQSGPGWLAGLVKTLGLLVGGYLAVTFPWYLRNLQAFGSLFPPGGGRSMWLTRYEDLFLYPADILTFDRWLRAGTGQILGGWWNALGHNLQTFAAVQASITLIPFISAGAWVLRKKEEVGLGVGMWLVTLLVFTFVFPYQGINGSFYHSGAAMQPLFWALAPVGLDGLVDLAARWRKWEHGERVKIFLATLLTLTCLLLTVLIASRRLAVDGWNATQQVYQQVEQKLAELGASDGDVVMVNNPPGYFTASQRPAVVIPAGDAAMLRAAALKYDARYLLLDGNNSQFLGEYYPNPRSDTVLTYLGAVEGVTIYEINR